MPIYKYYQTPINPPKGQIYVFGSNRAGRHGKGAALTAKQLYGAVYGQGEGLQGRSYGIPTKDEQLSVLTLKAIKEHVERFKAFTHEHPELTFYVTRVGCGLAAYDDCLIAPMFSGCHTNCIFSAKWSDYLENPLYRVIRAVSAR